MKPTPAPSQVMPACPNCGTATDVVRMPASLTPWERPDPEFDESRYYCRVCSHDFVPDPASDV